MAIRIEQKKNLNAVEFISGDDDAIDVENSDIEEYMKTGDVTKLKFLADKQPTIFMLNFEFKGNEAMRVKDSVMSGRDSEGKPALTLGTWAFKIAKLSLKGIKNPDDLPEGSRLVFKKDEKGYAHDDLITQLDKFGIVDEIFKFYSSLTATAPRLQTKNS